VVTDLSRPGAQVVAPVADSREGLAVHHGHWRSTAVPPRDPPGGCPRRELRPSACRRPRRPESGRSPRARDRADAVQPIRPRRRRRSSGGDPGPGGDDEARRRPARPRAHQLRLKARGWGHPAQRPSAMVAVDHGSPDGAGDVQGLVGPALDPDDLADVIEAPRPFGGRVQLGVPRIHLKLDEVHPVSLAVGEAPGHAPRASHDHRGRPRQRHSRDAVAGPRQRHPVPGPGHREAQVHVVGEDRSAVLRERPGHGPVVASRGEGLPVRGAAPRGG
jgi:hypothetical protein